MGNNVYYIGYITKKLQWNVFSVNPLYLIINKIKGHFEEVDGEKYLIINSKNDKYNYMKIKFNTDDNIPLKKIIYFSTITIIMRSITKKDDKYHPQLFLDDCLYGV